MKPFDANAALAELRDYFREMAAFNERRLSTVSSAPGEANTIDGERQAYEHAQEMVESYQTRLDLIARNEI